MISRFAQNAARNGIPSCRKTPSGRRASQPRGFTLIEILLALGLCLLLMAAVYAAFDWYNRISSGRFAETERAQISRALMNRLQVDIRSVVYTLPKEGQGAGGGGQAADELAEETVVIENINAGDAFTGQSRGVTGDENALVLHVSKPPRGMGFASFLEGGDRTSDLISVSYFLADENAGGLRGEVGRQFAATNGVPNSAVQGLSRLEGDRMKMDKADTAADDQTLAEHARILSREVNYLKFRYFDGYEWVTAWDSDEYQALPRAIEITIGFRPREGESSDASASLSLRRFVVPLPLSVPPVEE